MSEDQAPTYGELCACGHLAEEHKREAPGKWSTLCTGGDGSCRCYRFERRTLPFAQFRR